MTIHTECGIEFSPDDQRISSLATLPQFDAICSSSNVTIVPFATYDGLPPLGRTRYLRVAPCKAALIVADAV
jgi:hypothetical protein